jgi:ribosomal protein L14E/L6E/L27E
MAWCYARRCFRGRSEGRRDGAATLSLPAFQSSRRAADLDDAPLSLLCLLRLRLPRPSLRSLLFAQARTTTLSLGHDGHLGIGPNRRRGASSDGPIVAPRFLIAARDSSFFPFARFPPANSPRFLSLKKNKKNQALVDRPDAVRKALNFKRLALTDIKIDVPRAANKSVLAKALADSGAFEKFAASAWGQKLARREAKAGLTDLERYKASVKRSARAKAIRAKLG